MAAQKKPHVLMLDDHEDEQRPLANELEGRGEVTARVLHPQDVTLTDLEHADLVLVDWKLDDWPARDDSGLPISLKPRTGVALSAVLRVYLQEKQRPTGFAIHSGKLEEISPDLPAEPRVHLLAKANNQEWVFQKGDSRGVATVARQVTSLAKAVQALAGSPLPEDWLARIVRLLDIPAAWKQDVLGEIEKFRPPTYESAALSYNLGVLRWLLHRILPYPCFLLDEHRLAADLHVTVESLRKVLSESSELTRLLEPCEYRGVLSDFLGRRWWKPAVDASVAQVAGTGIPSHVHKYFEGKIPGLCAVEGAQNLVCVNQHGRVMDGLYKRDEVVEVNFEDWPPYTHARPYVPITEVKANPALQSLVALQDRDKLR